MPKTYRSPDLSLFLTGLCARKYPGEGVLMKKTIEVIKDIRTLCTHVFEGGHRCASPALQRETFCYYHHPNRKPIQNPTRRRSRRQSFALPLPSGQLNLQHAVYEVIRRLAANQITNRRAGMILTALDNATRNSPHITNP